MRALKILMAVMGLLIIAGIAVLGITISQRMSVPKLTASAVLDEPAGTHITQISASSDRLSLLLQGGGPDRLIVMDLAKGQVVLRSTLSR